MNEDETALSSIEDLSEVNTDVRYEFREDAIEEDPLNGSNDTSAMSTADVDVGLGSLSLAIADIHQNRAVDSDAEYTDIEWLEEELS